MKRKSKHQSEPLEQQGDADTHAKAAPQPGPSAEAPQTAAVEPDGEWEAMRENLSRALAEAEDWKDQFLRAKAETENTRRRAEKEIATARKYAIERFATEMLAVRDSLELARNVDLDEEDASAVEKMLEGLNLTLKQIDTVFGKFAIQEVAPAVGDKLDPERHQAMSVQESTEIPPNHIVMVMQKGYTLQDRLIRPAMVIVAKAATPEAAPVPESEKLEKTE